MKTVTTNGVTRLDRDEIEAVFIKEVMSGQYAPQYGERPSRYMVQLRGEKRKRRVYARPIGNVSVAYLKVGGKQIYCEMSLDHALYAHSREK
jgi:hypothetical protein